MPAGLRALFLGLGALLGGFVLLPDGGTRALACDVFATACIALGFLGARRIEPPARRGWMLVLAGFAGWVLGDIVFSVEQYILDFTSYPAPSDIPYLVSYGVVALGLLHLVKGRQNRSDHTPLLDAAIIAVGFGIIIGTFLIAPIASDSTVSVAGRLVASGYPIADVLLLGVLFRLWATVGSRTPAFRLLVVALVSTMTADIVWNVIAMTNPQAQTPVWLDVLWQVGYLGAAAGACTSSAPRLGNGGAVSQTTTSARRRLVALGLGLLLPGVTLLLNGALGFDTPWKLVAVGSIVLSLLVLVRMALLVRTVEEQAVQLAALARSDGLTGAPNRRTWDHEIGRAFQQAEDTDASLSIALIDLDHFKRYNDEHGHQAGDLLLREAVAAWSDLLQPGELLARYGGEEFGLLMPGSDEEQTAQRLQQMQRLTPRGQHFSAGVAAWAPGSEPSGVVELADQALYDAKHAGRACVRIASTTEPSSVTPPVQIALQPIVELGAGTSVGHEALSRFADGNPEVVFAQAHRAGYGAELEAAAIRAALLQRPERGYLSVNVSVEALVSDAVRSVLPTDLHGIVIEITEQTDTDSWDDVIDVVSDCRARGASIAIDDWGRGYSNVERMMRLRPEVVKLDRSLLTDLDDSARQDALRALVEWARSMGAKVCAEGVETASQWHTLRDLGIQLGQGYHFGRPTLTAQPSPEPVASPEDATREGAAAEPARR